ncbi:longchainfattyacid ligase [Plasmopara halstedii]|uniref:Longchainfattyacid ligase n=1 Tax=Plasmopara halstedii TaxID=4781 RepID=A0A0P1AHR0_PLAHL|nr:longchainfattyacid ligase [Plasmopara halstedii]CEG40512.1 longchainfattyacid ligase [Plasmopara halstedii]|eukprot:XP_024576881.1 longchainfattyacid ligase [Plasmopara halstedii]
MVLGGRVRLIFSGSAPLSTEVKEFLKVVFCCDVLEGYGLSETAAAATVGSADMPLGNHVGTPLMHGQVQLEDVPEMGYTSRDKPRPRGEICLKSPTVFAGYYKEPAKTCEVFDERGWFHTGDIGCWNADGTLGIIDRKKNFFKLSQGEYVAVEKIENIYSRSKYVAQLFAYGDSLQSFLVGILVPDPEVAEAWANERNLSGSDASSAKVINNPEFQKAVLVDMARVAKQANLRGFELVKKVHFHHDPFSLEQGLITPTFKLKRPQLKAFFEQQIAELYKK